MTLKLYNSLTRRKEEFRPIDPANVRMYVCGPTVYDYAHIGNARAITAFDLLYRVLRHEYGEGHVKYVRNITDVEDKIMAAAKENGETIESLTARTTAIFREDMAALGNLPPDVEPRATEYIKEMIALIERLIASGHAYAAEGHALFRVASYAKYGALARRSRKDMIAGARVEVAPYKEDPRDFVLWKPSTPDQPGWDSLWGRGRPGWHIECSAMSENTLGPTFDIHGGGLDLIFPHHENEIAQSVCAHDGSGPQDFARYWMHNGMLTVGGAKMAKSDGNFITVRDALRQAPGEIIRLALLMTHYRDPLDWTESRLQEAETTFEKFYRVLMTDTAGIIVPEIPPVQTLSALRDDLNASDAISYMHSIVNNFYATFDPMERARLKMELKLSGNLMGLLDRPPLEALEGDQSNAGVINELVADRARAREERRFADADRIRGELAARAVLLDDGPQRTDWRIETYWVQLWPDGRWDGKPYQRVRAGSPRQAAEKLYGGPLTEIGSHGQIRAQVRIAGRSSGIVFYERQV